MPSSAADLADEITLWRRDMHANPELQYNVHRTAGIVAEKLNAFGRDEVAPGVGKSGVVGVIRGRKYGSGRVLGLRPTQIASESRASETAY